MSQEWLLPGREHLRLGWLAGSTMQERRTLRRRDRRAGRRHRQALARLRENNLRAFDVYPDAVPRCRCTLTYQERED